MHPNFNKTQENVFNRRNGELKMFLNATNDVKYTEPPNHVQINAVFLDLRYIPLDDLRADVLPQHDNYDGKRTSYTS